MSFSDEIYGFPTKEEVWCYDKASNRSVYGY